MLRYVKRNWLTFLLGSSLVLSVYNNFSNKSVELVETKDVEPSPEILKVLEELEQVRARFDATDKKIKTISRLKTKFANLEKTMMMSLESCGTQITGLSDNLGAMEGVYRQSLDDLDDKTRENTRLLEDHDKQLRALEQQSMMLLMKGVTHQMVDTDSRSVLSDE